jgi:hypothetical protein
MVTVFVKSKENAFSRLVTIGIAFSLDFTFLVTLISIEKSRAKVGPCSLTAKRLRAVAGHRAHFSGKQKKINNTNRANWA